MLRSMDVTVQPAVSWMGLNDEIERSGLFFPVDPAPSVSSTDDRLSSLDSSVDFSSGKNWWHGRHKLQVNAFCSKPYSNNLMMTRTVVRMQCAMEP